MESTEHDIYIYLSLSRQVENHLQSSSYKIMSQTVDTALPEDETWTISTSFMSSNIEETKINSALFLHASRGIVTLVAKLGKLLLLFNIT